MARGYDPVQRSEQWKRRVDREEVAICNQVLGGMGRGPVMSADARLHNLEQTLFSGRGVPSGGGGFTAASGASGAIGGPPRSAVASSRGSSRARMAGCTIAQTPRGSETGTPRYQQSRAGSVLSGADSMGDRIERMSVGAGSAGSGTAMMLKAQLEDETRRRQKAEAEVERLQTMVTQRPGSTLRPDGGHVDILSLSDMG
mmetsp:Transcript_113019/g.292230  ORF Transcript_113019/g.292230 Transcript_113019/m.292230 type:complete len:200 (-) Transcript_113019:134-733(-)